MAGAYTAVPAVTPDPPDVPPGWLPGIPGSGGPGGTSADGVLGGDGYWPFPPPGGGGAASGPFPPGYDPDYSFNTTVPASTAYDSAISVSTQLRDQTDYTTGNPGGSSSVIWSATVNGSLRRIRFDGAGSYVSSVSSSYSSSAGFWGASSALDVELTEDDKGKNLTISVTSTVGDSDVADSKDIIIINLIDIKLELLSWDNHAPSNNYRAMNVSPVKYIDDVWAGYGQNNIYFSDLIGLNQSLVERTGEIEDNGISSTKSSMLVTQVPGSEYRIQVIVSADDAMNTTFKATLIYRETTYTRLIDNNEGWVDWIIVDEDGVLTVTDP